MTTNRYREARELAGLTLGQAALRLGPPWGRMLLSDLEEHDEPVSETLVNQLASIYDVHPAWLAGRSLGSLSPDDPRVNMAQLAKLTAADRAKFLRTMAAVLGPPPGG